MGQRPVIPQPLCGPHLRHPPRTQCPQRAQHLCPLQASGKASQQPAQHLATLAVPSLPSPH